MSIVSNVIERISEDSLSNSTEISSEVRDSMSNVLEELMTSNGDIFGATVSSIDGLAWSEKLQPGFDQHRFAAMSSSLLAIADELANEVDKSETQNVLIEGDRVKILMMHAGPMLLLTVFSRGTATLGMVLAHAKRAAESINTIVVE